MLAYVSYMYRKTYLSPLVMQLRHAATSTLWVPTCACTSTWLLVGNLSLLKVT